MRGEARGDRGDADPLEVREDRAPGRSHVEVPPTLAHHRERGRVCRSELLPGALPLHGRREPRVHQGDLLAVVVVVVPPPYVGHGHLLDAVDSQDAGEVAVEQLLHRSLRALRPGGARVLDDDHAEPLDHLLGGDVVDPGGFGAADAHGGERGGEGGGPILATGGGHEQQEGAEGGGDERERQKKTTERAHGVLRVGEKALLTARG